MKGRELSVAIRRERSKRWVTDIRPTVESAMQQCGSLRTTATLLTERGIPARRGGQWTAVQVKRVLQVQ